MPVNLPALNLARTSHLESREELEDSYIRDAPAADLGLGPLMLPALSPSSSPRRPPLEKLLERAEGLARVLTVGDPRGRLLQIALLRRDHTLLDAVVRTIETKLPKTRGEAAAQSRTLATVRPPPTRRPGRRPPPRDPR